MIGIAIVLVCLLFFVALAFAPCFKRHEACRPPPTIANGEQDDAE